MLLRRLETLPKTVENIYRSMLQKIDKHHKEEAAWYLAMVLYATETYCPPSICACAIARFGLEENMHLSTELTAENIVFKCTRVNSRIQATCGGLLDVVVSKPSEWGLQQRISWCDSLVGLGA